MAQENKRTLMTEGEYAAHRGVSRPYITKLAQNGVLMMRGRKVDVVATDTVLDDKPVDDVESAPAGPQPVAAGAVSPRPPEGTGPAGASFGQARTIEMVFRAKLRRLEFETKQGRLIEADAVRKRIAEHVRALRDGMLGLADRLAASLAAESDQKKVHVRLKTEITRELEALRMPLAVSEAPTQAMLMDRMDAAFGSALMATLCLRFHKRGAKSGPDPLGLL